MRGVILAGGTGSRLYPLTIGGVNKHALPIGDQPMIFYPIKKLVQSGIHDILIVTGKENAGSLVNYVGSGKEFQADFTFKIQDCAGGIAQALQLSKDFCLGHKFCVMLGDNLFEYDLIVPTKFYEKDVKEHMSLVLLKEVYNPRRFGVCVFNSNGELIEIEEKPEKPKSKEVVTGCYYYDDFVFEIIKTLKPSARGELEISDVNNWYVRNNSIKFFRLKGDWIDCGTHESMHKANQLVWKWKK